MDRRTLLTGSLLVGYSKLLGQTPLPPRARRPNPFPILRQLRLGDYWALIDVNGSPPDVVETVSITLTVFPGRTIDRASVWTILTEKTGLLEPQVAVRWVPSVVYELGGQPRFVIVRVPVNRYRGAWIYGHWWFKINDRLALGAEVNIKRQVVEPADSLTLTLADRTTGLLL